MVRDEMINKVVGHWKIKGVDYNVVTKKISVKALCIKCNKESNLQLDKFKNLENYECMYCDNVVIDSNLDNDIVVTKVSYDVTQTKIINSEKDRYIIDKLRRTWKEIISNKSVCSEWLESYDEFEKWSLNNGYKPWKVLDRYVKEYDYMPDNCFWRLDNRGIEKGRKLISEDNSISNSVGYIKNISYNLENLKGILHSLEVEGIELLSSSYIINKGNISDCVSNIRECEKYLSKCSELINDIQLRK